MKKLKIIKKIEKLNLWKLVSDMYAEKEDVFLEYNKEFRNYKKFVNELVKKYEKDNKKKFLILFFKKEKMSSALLSGELRFKLKNHKNIIIVCNKKENKSLIRCSCRSFKDVINEIIPKVFEKFGGSGGGHPLACGASIEFDKFEEMKKKLEEELSKLTKENEKV